MTYDLKWYADASTALHDIYVQELGREPDLGGLYNWLYHVREEGRNPEWIRAEIRKSPEYIEKQTAPAAPVPPAFNPLPRLVVRGDRFALETGERFTAIEHTDFRLYQRFLNEGSEAIRPVLEQRRDLGINMVRVLGMCHGMFHFYPSEYHPEFYARLAPFCDRCAEYGLYVEFTVFADATRCMPNHEEQAWHWLDVGKAAQPITNLLVEAVNEADQPINHLAALTDLKKLPGVICSHGSNGSEATPVRPWFDYETFHTNGAFEWWRKGGHNGMELSHGTTGISASKVPILVNENTRYPDQESNLNHLHDAAWGAAGLTAGSCVHTPEGKMSELLVDGIHGVQAHVAGAKMFPLEFQDGTYSHDAHDEDATDLRVYRMTLADGRQTFIRIRK